MYQWYRSVKALTHEVITRSMIEVEIVKTLWMGGRNVSVIVMSKPSALGCKLPSPFGHTGVAGTCLPCSKWICIVRSRNSPFQGSAFFRTLGDHFVSQNDDYTRGLNTLSRSGVCGVNPRPPKKGQCIILLTAGSLYIWILHIKNVQRYQM